MRPFKKTEEIKKISEEVVEIKIFVENDDVPFRIWLRTLKEKMLLSKLIKEITSSKKWAHIKNIHIKTSKIV
ncbi:MAG: hypothetical protein WC827_04695 [Candidatus Paceibacterota bacterium]|jgi:hypothetical protein